MSCVDTNEMDWFFLGGGAKNKIISNLVDKDIEEVFTLKFKFMYSILKVRKHCRASGHECFNAQI